MRSCTPENDMAIQPQVVGLVSAVISFGVAQVAPWSFDEVMSNPVLFLSKSSQIVPVLRSSTFEDSG